ncbi:hypothetical protein Purlil1_10597 [Purpureocillium lilacinum]|uniref:ATP synthase subunit delta, mitochondrial n=1 Tax=Purpureocillium lilacinum TaxID=33203 RepID=A0ABR0BM47_PURLI|nr:hypothetical protein Purlil1_10597 [Purpureocillium lilacinum]
MNSLRIARAAIRARPAAMRAVAQRRTYAEAVPDKPLATTTLTDLLPADQAEHVSASPGMEALPRRAIDDDPEMQLGHRPTPSIYKSQDVVQVNIPAETGEMGVLANHVPAIEQLKPGVVEVVEESGGSKQFFRAFPSRSPEGDIVVALEAAAQLTSRIAVSGGFATVQPGSAMSINAVEGYPLEDFSADAIRSQIAEAQKVANGNGSEQDIAEAKIELEVLETLAAHVK